MSFLNKVYSFDKEENFKEFVDSLGLPENRKEEVLNYKPSQSLKKEGDEYILSTTSISGGGSKDLKFKDGVEFDEEIAPGFVGKSKFVVDGNVVIQNQSFDDFTLVYRREYSDDQLVVVITTSNWDGVARRYYKAV